MNFLRKQCFGAVLAVNDLPVVWRFSCLASAKEESAILSAARTSLAVGKDCGIESSLDRVMLHGDTALARKLDLQRIEEQLGVPVQRFEGPTLDESAMAFGLALGCLDRNQRAFDLAKSLKPPPSLWELFRWRETALQVVLLVCMAFLLVHRLSTLNESCETVQIQSAQHAWVASMKEQELQKEKDQLEQEVAAVESFLGGRIAWSSYGRSLSESLPDNVFFTCIEGISEVQSTAARALARPEKSFVIKAAVSIPPDGLIPREIDRFLNTLREHPLLKQDFPVVELAEFKQVQPKLKAPPIAMLTVICLPNSPKKKASKS